MSPWLARAGVLLLALLLYTGTRAARELTPEVRASRRQGRRLALTAVQRHHFGSERGWRYWRWTRGLLVVWAVYVLLLVAAYWALAAPG